MLLLVVLSMLVLFMLLGTAFIMSSNQYRAAATGAAKANRVGTPPDDLADRALMQVLRDTNNASSVVRYHSLLRDLYGTDGFEAVIYSPAADDLFDPTDPAHQVTRFAGATTGGVAQLLGPTQGQLIDIYVRELAYKANDPLTPINEFTALVAPDARHVLRLEPDVNGQPQMLFLPLTRGYYNGCLLTITTGPASGQSTRILDYEYIPPDIDPNASGSAAPFPRKRTTRIFRFRVMAFPRADGLPLQIDNQVPQLGGRPPEILDLAGATFIVNGRPYNGTGVGYNPLAAVGDPRLTARERMRLGTVAVPAAGSAALDILHPEVALTPNSTHFFATDPTGTDILGPMYRDPTGVYLPLNPSIVPIADRPLLWRYHSFVGSGDADESYDAADFQNMFLALQTVTPRARGRVKTDAQLEPFEVDDPAISGNFERLDLEDLPLPSFHRPDLMNYWFHRLVVFAADPDGGGSPLPGDVHVAAVLQPYGVDGIRGSVDDPGVAVEVRDQIVALKRKISLRPLREDHPNFDGSNPLSRPVNLSGVSPLVVNGNIAIPYWEAVGPWDVDNDNDGVPDSVWVDLGEPVQAAEDGTRYKPLFAFLIMDLDSRLNVNAHGLVEDIMPTNLDPTLQTPGNLAHDVSPSAPPAVGTSDLLSQGIGYGPADISLRPVFPAPWIDQLGGIWLGNRVEDSDGNGQQDVPPQDYPIDDYATLLAGRVKVGNNASSNRPLVTGRHGMDPWWNNDYATNPFGMVFDAAAGITSFVPGLAIGPPDLLTMLKFFGYPESVSNYVPATFVANSFSTPPDLMGRYSLGLDYAGQPAYEHVGEPIDRPLVADSPYELDLSADRRRDTRADDLLMRLRFNAGTGTWETDYVEPTPVGTVVASLPIVAADTDDAPFATADLERVLRAYDADAGTLPSRLWDVVGAFDPIKLEDFDPFRVTGVAMSTFGTAGDSERLAAAQQLTAVNRRLVTTDSYDLPVPSGGMPSYVSELGPDGMPGRAGVDDDPDGDPDSTHPLSENGVVDDATETGAAGSDDFQAVTGTPFAQGTIVDLLHYRVFLELRKKYIEAYVMRYIENQSWSVPLTPAQENQLNNALRNNLNSQTATIKAEADTINQGLAQILLAPEVIAGQRMDLNRPFGDGRDNNGNGVVDEPLEAGEPFVDQDGNGMYDSGEPFGDLDGNGTYTYPVDQLWQGLTAEPISFDYLHGDTLISGSGRLRDNGVLQRQAYARQFYVLMMLMVDDDYLDTQNVILTQDRILHTSTQDGNINVAFLQKDLANQMALRKLMDDGVTIPSDPDQRAALIEAAASGEPFGDANQNGVYDLVPVPESYSDVIANGRYDPPMLESAIPCALRKLTARRIAQWAINCVDFRDADAIMTPFEYDENPFDGWNCTEYNRNTGLISRSTPIDGDVATNENWGGAGPPFAIDTPPFSGDDFPPDRVNGVPLPQPRGGDGRPPQHPGAGVLVQIGAWQHSVSGLSAAATRDVVWGTERPELLITETLAFHDRRATDEGGPGSIPTNASIFDTPPEMPLGPNDVPPDFDLDQRLKPRGSLFVELYNPWSPDGEKPAELYDTPNGPGTDQGVMLNRLSDVGVQRPDGYKYSPVWRLTVLRDPIGGRLTDQTLQLLQVDPDGFGADMDQDAERWIYFTTGGDTNRDDDKYIAYTGGTADYELQPGTKIVQGKLVPEVPEMDNLQVWVPPRPYQIARNPQSNQDEPHATASRYFIARTERVRDIPNPNNDTDVPIAPILPGRYAVIGSSGLQLTGTGISGNLTPPTGDSELTTRFVTSLSRLPGTESDEQTDKAHRQGLGQTRRIELWPLTDPDQQQVLVGENGGQEFARIGGGIANVTDSDPPGTPSNSPHFGVPGLGASRAPVVFVDTNGDGIPDDQVQVMEACVAIPVEDMSISEPPEGYPSLLYQQRYYEEYQKPLNVVGAQLNDDGELAFDPAYDRPLDMEFDLVRNGTTQKYRTLHLQRLANPMLPWNPAPPNVLHQPNLPVNPYRTIDSQSVDLTAYNGASEFEGNMLPTTTAQNDPSLAMSRRDWTQEDLVAPLPVRELEGAPNFVLWALIYLLQQEKIALPIDARIPDGLRKMIKTQPDTVEGYLSTLENAKGGSPSARATLLEDREDTYTDPSTGRTRRWDGEWGWHLFRRVLPEDYLIPDYQAVAADFRQRLHMKSLERGADSLGYLPATNQWTIDPGWEPRLLWKQERPDFMLLPLGAPRVSDLKNVRSRRVLRREGVLASDYRSTDDDSRSLFYRNFGTTSGVPYYANGMFDPTKRHIFDYVLENTLGFANEAYAPELDIAASDRVTLMTTQKLGAPEIVNQTDVDTPEPNELYQWNSSEAQVNRLTNYTPADEQARRQRLVRSTYPWLAWNNRPFVSADEILQVPASSSSLMLRDYSVINSQTPNPYDGSIVDNGTDTPTGSTTTAERAARQQAPFGHLLNFFMASASPALVSDVWVQDNTDVDNDGDTTELVLIWTLAGAPNFYRILDYVQVPSRYVGTDTMLDPAAFNDVPSYLADPEPVGTDITGPDDPRYMFQPPFNKVSRQRDPGRVNLNTVIGRREIVVGMPSWSEVALSIPHIWSEVYDGIMHRYQDGNPSATQLGHFGPAWRDVTLSRRGYAQLDAADNSVDQIEVDPTSSDPDPPLEFVPDTFTFGLNRNFPTFFANPFRSPEAGDLVPLVQMWQNGVDASWLRVHPRIRGNLVDDDGNGTVDDEPEAAVWGDYGVDDDGNGLVDDIREAGYHQDDICRRGNGAIPEEEFDDDDRDNIPLFSETTTAAAIDASRNPYMMYEPMTRLGNLVTTRSGVFAIWVTVGYFEVEEAPDWDDPDVRARFGGNMSDPPDEATIAARALYDRVYPEGYALGSEMGNDTGDVKRQRAFFIVDRTEPVGFKPGEDLNVQQMIRVRRRIE